MAKHNRPASLARAIEKRIREAQLNIIEAHRLIVVETYGDSQELASGNIKTKQLRRENHPFGRGLTTPRGKRRKARKSLPINVQSGRMRSALKLQTIKLGPRVWTYSINFRGAPGYANFVLSPDGTRKMRGRGYWREVEKRYKSRKLGVKLAFRK